MKKILCHVLVSTIFFGVLSFWGGGREAAAEVSVNINLGPPHIVVAEPPELVLVPDLQLYFVPHPEIDVFFFNGFWWSLRGKSWYRAKAYNGPWGIVKKRHVPAPLFRIPRDYRERYNHEHRIPYRQWKEQGRHHEREEHRDRHEDRKEGRGHGRR